MRKPGGLRENLRFSPLSLRKITYHFVIRDCVASLLMISYLLWTRFHIKNPKVKEKERESMTLSDYINRQVPEYYDWMYLDGYTPE